MMRYALALLALVCAIACHHEPPVVETTYVQAAAPPPPPPPPPPHADEAVHSEFLESHPDGIAFTSEDVGTFGAGFAKDGHWPDSKKLTKTCLVPMPCNVVFALHDGSFRTAAAARNVTVDNEADVRFRVKIDGKPVENPGMPGGTHHLLHYELWESSGSERMWRRDLDDFPLVLLDLSPADPKKGWKGTHLVEVAAQRPASPVGRKADIRHGCRRGREGTGFSPAPGKNRELHDERLRTAAHSDRGTARAGGRTRQVSSFRRHVQPRLELLP